MADSDMERSLLVPGLARLLRARDFRSMIVETTGRSDRHTVIVGLPEDEIGYVFDRLADSGGVGVIATPSVAGGYLLAIVWPASPARLAVAAEDDKIATVDDRSTVGLFFDYLREAGQVVVGRQVTARLVDQRQPDCV